MSASVASRAARAATAVTAGTLLAAGLGTATLLHGARVRSQDQVLLAAAHGGAHTRVETWEAEGSRPEVEVDLVRPGEDPGIVPAPWVGEALEAEGPVFRDLGTFRVLLLPVEGEETAARRGAREDADGEAGEVHGVVVARVPRVRPAESAGPFALAYAAIATVATLAAGLGQRWAMRGALEPLRAAARDASQAVGQVAGFRLEARGEEEVRVLLDALNALLERVERAMEVQARFTSEAAHELRTPIAVLRGEIEVALRRPRAAEEYPVLLRSLAEEVARLQDLVDALLALARVDAGQAALGRERVRAGEVAEEAAAREQGALAAAGCTLALRVQEDAEAEVHRPLVVAAVGNLLRNAALHAPGTRVSLGTERRGPLVAFVVEDEGPGIPEGERDSAFDRFARGGAARRIHPSGLGLGLPLAREVARRHGGDCRVEEARSGRGARVTLTVRTLDGRGERVRNADV